MFALLFAVMSIVNSRSIRFRLATLIVSIINTKCEHRAPSTQFNMYKEKKYYTEWIEKSKKTSVLRKIRIFVPMRIRHTKPVQLGVCLGQMPKAFRSTFCHQFWYKFRLRTVNSFLLSTGKSSWRKNAMELRIAIEFRIWCHIRCQCAV